MPKVVLAVTHRPGETEKRIIQEGLEQFTEVRFLAELSDRTRREVLEQSTVILSLGLSAEEIAREEIGALRRLRFIQLVFSGVDPDPLSSLPESVTVACNKGAFAEPLAEHVLALVGALAKRLLPKHRLLSEGVFDQTGTAKLLKGGICGIVGMGANGREVARILSAIGMRVMGINRTGVSDFPLNFIGTKDQLPILLDQSDVLVLTLPLTRHTHHMIGPAELEMMKKDAILVNVARGAVVDQEALYRHLVANPGFLVGIDTWWAEPSSHGSFSVDFPFFDLPNLLGSPHVADVVPGMREKATHMAIENIQKFFSGGQPVGIVDRNDYSIPL